MTEYWNVPVSAVRTGDTITSSTDDILVTAVDDHPTLDGWFVVSGKIVRGYGKSNKEHRWSFAPDATMDIRTSRKVRA